MLLQTDAMTVTAYNPVGEEMRSMWAHDKEVCWSQVFSILMERLFKMDESTTNHNMKTCELKLKQSKNYRQKYWHHNLWQSERW
jgi:hypothetical protein